jgi:hypothetical protein
VWSSRLDFTNLPLPMIALQYEITTATQTWPGSHYYLFLDVCHFCPFILPRAIFPIGIDLWHAGLAFFVSLIYGTSKSDWSVYPWVKTESDSSGLSWLLVVGIMPSGGFGGALLLKISLSHFFQRFVPKIQNRKCGTKFRTSVRPAGFWKKHSCP